MVFDPSVDQVLREVCLEIEKRFNNGNKFIEVENELITRLLRPKNKINQSDLDVFLFEANKAWWLAKGKTITISSIKGLLTEI